MPLSQWLDTGEYLTSLIQAGDVIIGASGDALIAEDVMRAKPHKACQWTRYFVPCIGTLVTMPIEHYVIRAVYRNDVLLYERGMTESKDVLMNLQEEIYSYLIRVWFHGYTCQYAYTPKEARNELVRRLSSKTTLLMQAKARYSRLQRHYHALVKALDHDYQSAYPELQRIKSEMLAIRDEACYRYGLPDEVVQQRMF